MSVWILIALLAALTLVLVVLPFVRRHKDAGEAARGEYDLKVFRDQLREVERDVEQGVLDEAEAEQARIEIKRRMLGTDKSAEVQAKGKPSMASLGMASLLAAGVVGGGFVMYDQMGHPSMPDMPYAGRIATSDHASAAEGGTDMEAMIANLEERLEDDPDNLDGWMMLARSYRSMERYDDLQRALEKGVELSDRHPELLSVLGETLLIINQGEMPERARELFNETLEKEPRDFRARFYLAYDLNKQGNKQAALQGWVDLLAIAVPDSGWIPQVRQHIYGVSAELGIPPISLSPSAEASELAAQLAQQFDGPIGVPVIEGQPPMAMASAAPGPTAEDMAAASQLTPEEQNDMIRGMVQRLADRLEDEPDDVDGWVRLARAYRVLGDNDKALEAEAVIRELTGQ